MLRDEPRMKAYQEAIYECRSVIEGKIVLDIGAGTGILSVLCAQVKREKQKRCVCPTQQRQQY